MAVAVGLALPATSSTAAERLLPAPTPEVRQATPRYLTRRSLVIFRSLEPRGPGWLLSRDLSRACRRGAFKQAADRRYVAVLGEEVYGAALGGQPGLVDREARALPEVLYIFKGQGTTRCRVYHRSQ